MIRITLAVLVLAAGSARAATAPSPSAIARTQVATWQCQDALGVERSRVSTSPWRLGASSAYRTWVLELWASRRSQCLTRLQELRRQWNWQAWLPREWYAVGSCETGGGGPPNWLHANSDFVSAFGIRRYAYDEDAAVYGAPPWNDAKPPTPWQQYQAALGHYRLHGGFSGWDCKP